ncbi:trehalose operon repressor [Clostridiaceae bacterium M8S5]|nr:trehalose operon repressor [Clostridiaceae bacterium M8S5]
MDKNKKYLNIYSELINGIENNKIKANTKLPSENELMKKYNVSRATIRNALELLERNGYIQKIKGKGSFVLDINKLKLPVSGLTSFKELNSCMNAKVKTIVKELDVVQADDYLANRLEIPYNQDVWKVIRVREINDKRIILDKDYFNRKYVDLLTKEICENSIYEYLENQLGLKISFAKKEITVKKATQEDKEYLELEDYEMVVVVRSYVYLEDISLFQYGESRHRPDKFKFVDFARRNKM